MLILYFGRIEDSVTTDTMNTVMGSNVKTVSEEPNVDNLVDEVLNFRFVENFTNNENIALVDNFLREFDTQCSDNDDLNYNILDLDNLEYITYKNEEKPPTDSMFDGHSEVNYILLEHNYSMTNETITKINEFSKSEDNSVNNIKDFNNVDVDVGEEFSKLYDTKSNIENLHLKFVNFYIPVNIDDILTISDDIISISDDENVTDIEPELDVISISSESFTEDIFEISDSDTNSCGYHSSDFEFISEDEAKKDGLIKKGIDKVKTNKLLELNSQEILLDYFNMPDNNNFKHKIPQDRNYINMFERNIPFPVHYTENKSTYINSCSMLPAHQELGFDMNIHHHENIEKHVRDEANESENKILFMYPSENRGIRRTQQFI